MSTKLEEILLSTRATVDRRKAIAGTLATLERQAAARVPRDFAASLRQCAVNGPAIIAELKRRSPSKGLLREDYRPADVAAGYEQAGAAAISVLTDEPYFGGSLSDLAAVSDVVSIPVLRKDFMVDAFQMLEARAAGADAILLIVAAHTDRTLRELHAEAQALALGVLCEVHDREELDRAVDLGFEVIGVNSRNLKDLSVDESIHDQILPAMPKGALRVAESGIRTPEDIRRLRHAGYDAFLVGEALMRDSHPGAALALLIGREVALER